MDTTERQQRIQSAIEEVQDARQEEILSRAKDMRADAIHYLSYGNRSSGKLRQQLLQKGYLPQHIAPLLLELEQEGYLKDRELIRIAWQGKRGAKSESLSAFSMRMARNGIAHEVIDEFLALQDRNKTDLLSLASFLKAKHLDTLRQLKQLSEKGERDSKLFNRLVRQCQGRGYSLDKIFLLLRRMGILSE